MENIGKNGKYLKKMLKGIFGEKIQIFDKNLKINLSILFRPEWETFDKKYLTAKNIHPIFIRNFLFFVYIFCQSETKEKKIVKFFVYFEKLFSTFPAPKCT